MREEGWRGRRGEGGERGGCLQTRQKGVAGYTAKVISTTLLPPQKLLRLIITLKINMNFS